VVARAGATTKSALILSTLNSVRLSQHVLSGIIGHVAEIQFPADHLSFKAICYESRIAANGIFDSGAVSFEFCRLDRSMPRRDDLYKKFGVAIGGMPMPT